MAAENVEGLEGAGLQSDHKIHRVGWLRAAVLGANDGLISTACLVLGVAAAHATSRDILLAGVAGLVAGSASMATGEYVSVSSQADTEKAELEIEQKHLEANWDHEQEELASIYADRGLNPRLAEAVASKLMEHDALEAHARDELGISETMKARPLQAALASAVTFSLGAALPLLVVFFAPRQTLMWSVSVGCLVFLALLGSLAAHAGGAPRLKATLRVTVWGAIAMAITSAAGAVVGAAV